MIELVVLGAGVLVSSMVAYALVQIGRIERDLAARTSEVELGRARQLATAPGGLPRLLSAPAVAARRVA
jgi:hypothetical protein